MSLAICLILFSGESGEIDQRHEFVRFLGLFSLYVQIFRQFDKKFIKQIWDVHRKVEILHYYQEAMHCSLLTIAVF